MGVGWGVPHHQPTPPGHTPPHRQKIAPNFLPGLWPIKISCSFGASQFGEECRAPACRAPFKSGRGGGWGGPAPPPPRDALEGKGPQRRPQQRLDRRWEEVAKAVGGGYCRLQPPSKLALGVRETVAGHRLGALEGGGGLAQGLGMEGGGVTSPPSNASPPPPSGAES